MKYILISIITISVICCKTDIQQKVGNSTNIDNNSDHDKIENKIVDSNVSQNEVNKFNLYVDSLRIKNLYVFKEYYNAINKLNLRYSNSSNPIIIEKVNYYNQLIKSRVPYDLEQIKTHEIFINDSIDNNEIKESFYISAFSSSLYHGKLKEALRYGSILKENFPNVDIWIIQDAQINEIGKSYELIENVHSSKEQDDIKLWKIGTLYYDLFKKVGPVAEYSAVDMSFPFSYYDSLINLYPKSSYADDAAFRKLNYNERASHEGGDNSFNLKAVEEYKKLLKQYPNTEYTPEILHRISWLYYECESKYQDKPKYYKLARSYAARILDDYSTYEKIDQVKELKQAIENSISKVLWELTISTNKGEYIPTEPIYVTFNLKNIGNHTKKICL